MNPDQKDAREDRRDAQAEQRFAVNEQRNIEAVYRVERMADDIGEIKGAMKEMASAVAKLALVEERQTQDRVDIGRVFRLLDLHDERIKSLELAQPLTNQTTEWVGKGVWYIVAAVLGALLSLVVISSIPVYKSQQAAPFVQPKSPS